MARSPLDGMTRDETISWIRAHETTTERDELSRLRSIQRAGGIVAPSTLEMAQLVAAAEDEEEGLKSGRLIACPNCGATVAPGNLMSASRGTACPDCYDDMSD